MAGAFDDLIPTAGSFDDLIPQAPPLPHPRLAMAQALQRGFQEQERAQAEQAMRRRLGITLPVTGPLDLAERTGASIAEFSGKIGTGLYDVLGATALTVAGEPTEAIEQLGVPSRLPEDVLERDLRGRLTPMEAGIKQLPAAGRVLANISKGTVESVPKIAALTGMQAAGVPLPVGAGLVFGTTEQGFDPKQAAIAAALPYIGKYGGEITGLVARKLGASSTDVVNAIKALGGLGAVAGAVGAEQLAEIGRLPEDQRLEAIATAIGSQIVLGPMGVKFERPGPAELAGRVLSENVKRTELPPPVFPKALREQYGITPEANAMNAMNAIERATGQEMGQAPPEWEAAPQTPGKVERQFRILQYRYRNGTPAEKKALDLISDNELGTRRYRVEAGIADEAINEAYERLMKEGGLAWSPELKSPPTGETEVEHAKTVREDTGQLPETGQVVETVKETGRHDVEQAPPGEPQPVGEGGVSAKEIKPVAWAVIVDGEERVHYRNENQARLYAANVTGNVEVKPVTLEGVSPKTETEAARLGPGEIEVLPEPGKVVAMPKPWEAELQETIDYLRKTIEDRQALQEAIDQVRQEIQSRKAPAAKPAVSTQSLPLDEFINAEPLQPRADKFSETTSSKVASEGWRAQESAKSPPLMWRDPATGKLYRAGGSSRAEGLRRLRESGQAPGAVDVLFSDAKTKEDAFAEAIANNTVSTPENLVDTASAIRKAREKGIDDEQIARLRRISSGDVGAYAAFDQFPAEIKSDFKPQGKRASARPPQSEDTALAMGRALDRGLLGEGQILGDYLSLRKQQGRINSIDLERLLALHEKYQAKINVEKAQIELPALGKKEELPDLFGKTAVASKEESGWQKFRDDYIAKIRAQRTLLNNLSAQEKANKKLQATGRKLSQAQEQAVLDNQSHAAEISAEMKQAEQELLGLKPKAEAAAPKAPAPKGQGWMGGKIDIAVTPERRALFEAVKAAGTDRAQLDRLLGDRAEWYVRRRMGGGNVFESLVFTMGWDKAPEVSEIAELPIPEPPVLKFQDGQKVMAGRGAFRREGVIAAPGPKRPGEEQTYFVKTNLGETLYNESDLSVQKAEPPAAPAQRILPAALAKRLLALSRERQTSGYGAENLELRKDVIEALTGQRPGRAKAGAKAVESALAEFFGMDREKMAGVEFENAVRDRLKAAAGEEAAEPAWKIAFDKEQITGRQAETLRAVEADTALLELRRRFDTGAWTPVVTFKNSVRKSVTEKGEWAEVPSWWDDKPDMAGPGGTTATDPVFKSNLQTGTSIKNAAVDETRRLRGQPPIMGPLREANQVVWDRVMARLDEDALWPIRLVQELKEKPRTPSADEVLALDWHYVNLREEYAKATRAGMEAYEDGNTAGMAEAKAWVAEAEKKLVETEQVFRKIGTEWGRSGQMRQRIMAEDYTLEAMEAKARAAKGFEPLTDAERAELVDLRNRLEAAEKRNAEAVAEWKKKTAEAEAARAIAEAKKELPFDKRVLDYAEGIVSKWKAAAQPAAARLKAWLKGQAGDPGAMSGPLDPRILDDFAIVGRAWLGEKTLDLAKFTDRLVNEFGETVRQWAQQIWDASNRIVDDSLKKVPEPVKQAVRKASPEEVIEASKDRMEAKVKKGELDALGPEIKKIVKAIVEGKPAITARELIGEVHTLLKTILPEITELEAADAISGRGVFWRAPQDPLSKQVRNLKTQIRLMGHQQDVLAKRPLPRTGYQPDPMSDLARREQQALNELKRKFGVVVTDPKTQLASALQARKTYVRHQMADLEAEIKTRTRLIKTRTSVAPDAELQAMLKRRDELKAEHETVFGKREMTAEQRLKLALAAAERNEAAWSARLEEARKGNFARPAGKPAVSSAELEIIKTRTEALREEVKELRDLAFPKKSPAELALQAFKARKARQLADYTERLAGEEFAPRQRKPPLDISNDPEAMRAQADVEAVKKEFEARRAEWIFHQKSLPAKGYVIGKEALNLGRAVKTSFDVSAVLRQGAFISLGHPARAARALAPMFRSLASEKYAAALEQSILSRPNAKLYEKSGLYLSSLEEIRLSRHEEAVMSHYARYIPGIRHSNRAFMMFLNKLRADSFDAMLGTLARKTGRRGLDVTQADLETLANYINLATGRGKLGRMEVAAEALATAFFSPRLVASRFQLLAGEPVWRRVKDKTVPVSRETRAMIAQEYGRFLAGLGVVYALGLVAGATVNRDPRSPDFGKLKFGNTRIDPLAGLAQITTLLGREWTGETINARGKTIPITGDSIPYGGADRFDVSMRFLRTKFSPSLGAVVDAATGENVVGEKVTKGGAALGLVWPPLAFNDILPIMREHGVPAGAAITLLSLFGMGLQNYDASKPRPRKQKAPGG